MSHVTQIYMSHVQPIADRVAQHLEIISKNFQFSTRRTRILTGFIIYYLVLIVNPMGRILVCWKSFRNNLEMLCHPIYNWLYLERRTHMNESCHANLYESWTLSGAHIWMSQVKSCQTYEWVMSHKYAWVRYLERHTHIWMNHVTHMDESCHTHIMSQVP